MIKMEKTKYASYINKFSNTNITDFTEDMKELNKGKVGLFHKKVKFASLTREEYDIYNNWTKQEQADFLNGYWNYYISMMD